MGSHIDSRTHPRDGRGDAPTRTALLVLLVLPILLASLVLSACSATPSPPAPARPNLLFITTDDQRFDMLGALHPVLETPTMDRLAAAGLRFENAFVTSPICAASRASLRPRK